MGKASTRAQNKWIAKAYDRINLTVPKGKKDVIAAHAAARGESVNGFINRAIDAQMERDSAGTVSNAPESPSEGDSAPGILTPAAPEAATEAAQKAGESPSRDILPPGVSVP